MSPIFGSDSRGAGRSGDEKSEEAARAEKVVINDKRRIDPETGKLREDLAGPGEKFPVDEGGTAGPTGESPVDDELALALMEVAERTSDLQRVSAEYANYRKRVDRDRESMVTAAKATVVAELLTVIDDLDRAKAHGDLTGAFKAVADRFTGVLDKLGVVSFGAEGDAFDPAEHEAVQFSTSDEVSVPTVTSVFRSGYHFGDKLLRPAVVVVTGPETEAAAPAGGVSDAGTSGAGVSDTEVVDAELVDAEVVDAELIDDDGDEQK